MVVFAFASTSWSSTTFSNIESLSNWLNCGACAGIGGNGPVDPYSLTQHISSPSLDGSSAQFFIGGSTPYGNALWWRQLGGSPATHFVYDFYYFIKDPSAPQALEFDVNDSINNQWYIFGTEC